MQLLISNFYSLMKKTFAALSLVLSLLVAFNSMAQDDKPKKEKATAEKKMAKADKKAAKDVGDDAAVKTAKAEKKAAKADKIAAMSPAEKKATKEAKADMKEAKADKKAAKETGDKMAMKEAKVDKKTAKADMKVARKEVKATPADYKAPIDRSMKGPNGEQVMTGPRSGKYYINKNGNKTYLSSLED